MSRRSKVHSVENKMGQMGVVSFDILKESCKETEYVKKRVFLLPSGYQKRRSEQQRIVFHIHCRWRTADEG